MVKLLVSKKVNLGAATVRRMSAVHLAAEQGQTDVIRELLAAGVSLSRTNVVLAPELAYVQCLNYERKTYLPRKGKLTQEYASRRQNTRRFACRLQQEIRFRNRVQGCAHV